MNQNNWLNAPFVREMVDIAGNMYRLGWDERNGGNISLLLEQSEIVPYLPNSLPQERISLGFDANPLAGRYFW